MTKYVIFAGVNGAGKSTLYHIFRYTEKLPRVNTDEIVRSFGDWRKPEDVVKAGKIAVLKIKEYMEQKSSFNQETTLCGKTVIRNIEKAKENGFIIEVHYVGLDSADIAKERVHQRVLKGGHGIPEEDIERRYKESLAQMQKILKMCDLVAFYDNSIKFRRIAIYRNGEIVRHSSDLPEWYIRNFT